MTYRIASLLLVAIVLSACSAVVSPDLTRLGDAGGSGTDLGMSGHDGGGTDGGGTDGGGHDAGPMCPATCDDGVSCTVDSCDAASGACVHMAQDGACGDGMRCSALMGCVPAACTTDASCDDANACNGQETCHPGMAGADPSTGCVLGTAPDCNDHADCTADSCSPATGCVHAPNDAACDDGLSCTADSCSATGCHHEADSTMCNGMCGTGATCSLSGPAPSGCMGGTTITCMTDGNPCTSDPPTCDPVMGCLHPPRDNDGDGHPAARATGTGGPVTCAGGDDCNDANPDVHPGALEVCNFVDDDCNGMTDEGGVCGTTGPVNDTCSGATAIPLLSGTGIGTLMGSASGSTTTAADDYITTCSTRGASGPDVVYSIAVPAPAGTAVAYDVTVTTRGTGTTFDTVLGISASPCGTFDLCNDDAAGGGTTSAITFCSVGGVTDYILVDGFDTGMSGSYTVSVTVSPRLIPCG